MCCGAMTIDIRAICWLVHCYYTKNGRMVTYTSKLGGKFLVSCWQTSVPSSRRIQPLMRSKTPRFPLFTLGTDNSFKSLSTDGYDGIESLDADATEADLERELEYGIMVQTEIG